MFDIRADILFESPVCSLKRNTTRAWITERDLLIRNKVIMSFISRRFPQDNPVETSVCFSETLNSSILPNNVESHLIERVCIILYSSDVLRLTVLECTFKQSISSSYVWFLEYKFYNTEFLLV